jgi:hypothetical protein
VNSVALEPSPDEERWPIAISLDRRHVAVPNHTLGFTFHATADGAVRGRTAALAGKVGKLYSCAFSPDSEHFGCSLLADDPPHGQWVMWSCPGGVSEARCDKLEIHGAPWVFWDDRHLVAGSAVFDAWHGTIRGNAATNEASFLGVSTGRQLWYLCRRDPFALVPVVHVASIELQPQWFRNRGPDGRAFGLWHLKPEGLSDGP